MKEKVIGNPYTANAFYYAVIYKHRPSAKGMITSMWPRHTDARQRVVWNNADWKKNGWAPAWSVKRLRFNFRGLEIDAYEHMFERKEKIKKHHK